jgi:hypothetical protein
VPAAQQRAGTHQLLDLGVIGRHHAHATNSLIGTCVSALCTAEGRFREGEMGGGELKLGLLVDGKSQSGMGRARRKATRTKDARNGTHLRLARALSHSRGRTGAPPVRQKLGPVCRQTPAPFRHPGATAEGRKAASAWLRVVTHRWSRGHGGDPHWKSASCA